MTEFKQTCLDGSGSVSILLVHTSCTVSSERSATTVFISGALWRESFQGASSCRAVGKAEVTLGTHWRRTRCEVPFPVRAATSLSTPEVHFSAPVNKLLFSSAPFMSNIEFCVCVCVCVCVYVHRSLLTDRYIYRQDNHTIIKQGVLFWHLFYFENWRDSLCLFSV